MGMTEPASLTHGTALVRRVAADAAKKRRDQGDGHPAVWKPWETVIAEASGRLRVEITDALKRLEADNARAGQILDGAAALAEQAEKRITEAAWAAWHRQMDAAAQAAEAILGPAQAAYEQTTSRAQTRYAQAVDTAKRAWDRTLHDAQQAEAIRDQIDTGVK